MSTWKKTGVALGALWLTHFALSALFLNAGILFRLTNKDPHKLELTHRYAFSLWPGRAWVRGFTLRIQDDKVQLYFALERATVDVELGQLFRRTFATSRIEGDGLKFALRFRRAPGSVSPSQREILPPIPGLPLDNFEGEKKRPPGNPWRIVLGGAHLTNVNEIWVEDYRYRGPAETWGDTDFVPGKDIRVTNGKVRALGGVVSIGGVSAVNNEETIIENSSLGFRKKDVEGWEFLRYLDAKISLRGEVTGLAFLNRYLHDAKWVRLEGGRGALVATTEVRQGKLLPGSHLRITSSDISTRLWNLRATGQGETSVRVADTAGGTLSLLQVKIPDLEVRASESEHALIQGKNFSLSALIRDFRLGGALPPAKVRLDLPEARITRLRELDLPFLRPTGLRLESGEIRVGGQLEATVGSSRDRAWGEAQVSATKLGLGYEKMHFLTDLYLVAGLRNGDVEAGRFELGKGRLALRRASLSVAREKEPRDWWGTAEILGGKIHFSKPLLLDGKVRLRAKDTRPLVSFFTRKAALPGFLKPLLNFTGMRASANLKVTDDSFSLTSGQADASNLHLEGWVLTREKARRGDLLIQLGPLAAGIALEDEVRVRLQDAERWYRSRNRAE